jgi:hypothetical protein
MYSPSPKSEVHLSTITLYMDISSNIIHQQNTWDVPFRVWKSMFHPPLLLTVSCHWGSS